MHNDWTSFSTALSYVDGNDDKSDFDFFSESYLQDALNSELSSEIIVFKNRPNITSDEGISTRGIIQQTTSDNKDSSKVHQVLCKIGTLNSGDYIYDTKLKRFWLVTGLVDNNHFYEKAVIYYCNWTVKFMSPINNQIVEYPVYCANAAQYNNGEITLKQIVVGSGQVSILIQENEETLQVQRETRFIVKKAKNIYVSFKLTQSDVLTYGYDDKGAISWMITECQTDFTNDDLENSVASNQQIITEGLPNTKITTKNKNLLNDWM